MNLLAKGISGTIGIISEIIAHRRSKKSARQLDQNGYLQDRKLSETQLQTSQKPQAFYTNGEPPPYQYDEHDDDISKRENPNTEQIFWTLDEAASALDTPSRSCEKDIGSVNSFAYKRGLPVPRQTYSPIPFPVILPQRRPESKSRGFIRAYAPSLAEYSGIDEKMFMDFLLGFEKASKASPVFDVINVACFAVGFVQEPIAQAVSTAVGLANTVASEMHGRYKRNTYLDQMNDTLFKPRGLFCMIMTFKPDNPYSPVVNMDLNVDSTTVALNQRLTNYHSMKSKFRSTSGVITGEVALPHSAPLVFPAIERAVQSDGEASKKRNALQRSGSFLNGYLDRRAQAKYAAMHPDSKLSLPPQKFASRFSDPNHAVNTGGLMGLLSGGHVNNLEEQRIREAQREADRAGVVLSKNDLRNAAMGRAPRKQESGLMSRMMQSDVLYFTIVNLPSELKLKEINQDMERMKMMQH